MATNLQVLLDHRPTTRSRRTISVSSRRRFRRRGRAKCWCGTRSCRSTPHARAAQRRQIYAAPQEVGAVMGGGTVGVVEASNNPRFKAGDAVFGMGG